MTLQELQIALRRCGSLAACDVLLQAQFHEIRPLFYGLTWQELHDNCRYLDYEDAFLTFENSPSGQAIRSGERPPDSVIALLIFFLSLFERSRCYALILNVSNLLPSGSLRDRGEALVEYKHITDARRDYLRRFDRILGLLQGAWNHGNVKERAKCEDLLQEYAIDSILEPFAAGITIRPEIAARFQNESDFLRYPILADRSVQEIFDLSEKGLERKRIELRSRIVESLHEEACSLAPGALLNRFAEEFSGEPIPVIQQHKTLPCFIDEQLKTMGAVYAQLRRGARINFNGDSDYNRIYLGTYFPKSVIESWNIFSELLSIPIIAAAFRQKDSIRVLDIGSGTGAAVVGTLLALKDWGQCQCRTPVEVTSMDFNQDALAKQNLILDAIREDLPFDLKTDLRHQPLPFDLDGFVRDFSSVAHSERRKYDVIICWKCLSEFYNVSFAVAQGIIRNTLSISSGMLTPFSLCVVSDVTTTDNGYEYFAQTFNRESNEYEITPQAIMRTIIPLSCATKSTTCRAQTCYTQRRFEVVHRLASHDATKIAYRVFAPTSFADSITATFAKQCSYRVNSARPDEACLEGTKGHFSSDAPCGYTGFFR
ncbi:hypothetical protein [uncultured Lamprocystis sp.]|jgi:SAM-dependent methyltransferase|uniref:hypothetical protein n=1 Tax=uncultured Lamprocystis sp. TaxID=543132 RepID=UPI0025FFFB0D|nr:hypothetical protein [uncultured Lamprocystis sp.]